MSLPTPYRRLSPPYRRKPPIYRRLPASAAGRRPSERFALLPPGFRRLTGDKNRLEAEIDGDRLDIAGARAKGVEGEGKVTHGLDGAMGVSVG